MKRFSNILVGVDLSAGDCFVSDELSPPTEEAIERAMWLAKLNSARLLFLYSLDVSAQAQRLIQENQGSEPTVVDHADVVLGRLVERAGQEGIAADCLVVIGKSWLEIIRQILRRKHDLVIVGTRHLGPVKSFLVGSTGIKLLRKCPCPVWVTQPLADRKIATVLVAHDLTSVGELALELGSSMAQLQDAQLHVLHALKSSEKDEMFPARVSLNNAAKYEAEAKRQIEVQLAKLGLTRPAQVHISNDPADLAILDHIERHDIELLVMGTVARAGIPGLITGNTAERLLPQIPCSVLAVKPEGFTSPVTLEQSEAM
jgi:universal stress protein E